MTRFDATEETQRRTLAAEAVVAHRNRDSDGVVFEAIQGDRRVTVRYENDVFEFGVSAAEDDRIRELLGQYPVFKIAQPRTRKAPEDTVYVSAVTDPKHAADFLEAAVRSVYGYDDDYRLWVVSV